MELVLLVCLVAAPDTCKEEALPISVEPIAEMQCMMGAQPIIAEWTGAHPKWQVQKWSCGVPGRRGRNA